MSSDLQAYFAMQAFDKFFGELICNVHQVVHSKVFPLNYHTTLYPIHFLKKATSFDIVIAVPIMTSSSLFVDEPSLQEWWCSCAVGEGTSLFTAAASGVVLD